MFKILREYSSATAFGFVIAFYWVGKYPENFIGMNIPDFSSFILLLFSIAGAIQYVTLNEKYNISELLFPALLVSVPIFGNIAEFILLAEPSNLWSNYIDYELLDVNNWLGFRSPIMSAIMFFFAARCLANELSKSKFVITLLIGATFHLIWGVSQFLYLFIPSLIENLPIMAGSQVGSQFNLIIVRASGLMLNAFPFAWFFLVIGVSLTLISQSHWALIGSILISGLSISRAFMAASLPLLLYCVHKGGKVVTLMFLLLFIGVVIYFGSDLALILEKRLDGDISSQSRLATNMLSLNEILRGNVLGVGYCNGYYTDSTAASLLLSSGIPGLVFYFAAWFLFFKELWIVSGWRTEVLLFGFIFFVCSLLLGSVEAQPGLLIMFVLYWFLRKRYYSEKYFSLNKVKKS